MKFEIDLTNFKLVFTVNNRIYEISQGKFYDFCHDDSFCRGLEGGLFAGKSYTLILDMIYRQFINFEKTKQKTLAVFLYAGGRNSSDWTSYVPSPANRLIDSLYKFNSKTKLFQSELWTVDYTDNPDKERAKKFISRHSRDNDRIEGLFYDYEPRLYTEIKKQSSWKMGKR